MVLTSVTQWCTDKLFGSWTTQLHRKSQWAMASIAVTFVMALAGLIMACFYWFPEPKQKINLIPYNSIVTINGSQYIPIKLLNK